MVEAMVKKAERLSTGHSIQNMHYNKVFDSFCSLLASTSPRAYKTFRNHFGGRSLRSMRYALKGHFIFEHSLIRVQVHCGHSNLHFSQDSLKTMSRERPRLFLVYNTMDPLHCHVTIQTWRKHWQHGRMAMMPGFFLAQRRELFGSRLWKK